MNTKIIRKIGVCSIALAALASYADKSAQASEVTDPLVAGYLTQVKLPATTTQASYNIGPAGVANPLVINLVENIGSALYMTEDAGTRTFYAVTDGGLAVGCKQFKKGKDFNADGARNSWGPDGNGLFCADEAGGSSSAKGKIYPDPAYVPKIYKMTLDNKGISVVNIIPISGTTIIPPRVDEARSTPAGTNTDFAKEYVSTMPHDLTGKVVPHSPVGIDPEAIVVLADGSFWVGEEYGPSLIHVATDGNVIEQVVPVGTEKSYEGSAHTVRFELPENMKMRKRNRGIEALAYDKTNNQLTFIVQNALANPSEDIHKKVNLHRMYTLQLDDKGNFGSVIHEYVYQAAPSYAGAKKQKNVRISEMRYYEDGKFLVLERDKQNKKDPAYTNQVLYVIDVAKATDILGKTSYDDLESKALEGKPYDIATVKKTTLFSSDASGNTTGNAMMPEGAEGFVLLNTNGDVMFIGENEYGLEGRDGFIKVISIPQLNK